MATKKTTLSGIAMWARVFEENRAMKDWQGDPWPFNGRYEMDLILDKANKLKLKEAGSAKKGKFDDDGNFIVKLTRKHEDRFEWASGAPEVVKADGSAWSFEEDGLIPNGSVVDVVITTYTTTKTPGTRLEKVIVLKAAEMPSVESKEKGPEPAPEVSASEDIPF